MKMEWMTAKKKLPWEITRLLRGQVRNDSLIVSIRFNLRSGKQIQCSLFQLLKHVFMHNKIDLKIDIISRKCISRFY